MAGLAIHAALRDKILSITGVSALVGTRVYPDAGPQTPTLPFVVFSRTDCQRNRAINRAGMQSAESTYAVTVWASSRAGACTLSELIMSNSGGLDGFSGVMGSGGDAVTVQIATVDNITDGYEAPQSGGELGSYATSFDVKIKHNLS